LKPNNHLVSCAHIISYLIFHKIHQSEHKVPWKWKTNGTYTSASAYAAHFNVSHPKFSSAKIWSAIAKPKCKFFFWLVLHRTTGESARLTCLPHVVGHVIPDVSFVFRPPKNVTHLRKDCSSSVAVWNHVKTWMGEVSRVLLCTLWNIWKENESVTFWVGHGLWWY
jgi:hypothetical protein